MQGDRVSRMPINPDDEEELAPDEGGDRVILMIRVILFLRSNTHLGLLIFGFKHLQISGLQEEVVIRPETCVAIRPESCVAIRPITRNKIVRE